MRLQVDNLASILKGGGTFVASSRFLASVAAHQFAREKIAAGFQSWSRPEILSVNGWLTNVWNAVRYSNPGAPALLSASQERELWRQLLEQAHPDLFDHSSAARLAISAAQTISEWQVPMDGPVWEHGKDSQQFRDLYRRVQKELRDRDCITRAGVWRLAPEWIRSGTYRPLGLTFIGFRHGSPAMVSVVQALGGSAARLPHTPRAQSRVMAKECSTFAEELETVARWTRNRLEQDSSQSIGVFVYDLAKQHSAVERIFGHVFDPGGSMRLRNRNAQESDATTRPFHINAAQSLWREPLVAGALKFLELLRPRITTVDASAILLSPFLAGASSERSARALADLNLRRNREIDVTLEQIEYRTSSCEMLCQLWRRVREVRSRAGLLDLAQWSELFADILKATGWPGDEQLNSHEQQVADSWNNALSELASLVFVSRPVVLDQALLLLRDALSSADAPQTGDWLSPVQILDLAQADGIEFDSAAVVGLSAENWPLPVRLRPFIPPQLQRSLNIPGTSPDMFEQAQSLFSVAPTMLVTYSGQLAPAVRKFVKSAEHQIPIWTGRTALDYGEPASRIESLEDSQAPPFQANETLTGGVGVIKSQALCPFRAFAEYRLHADRPEDACFGFDARDRGGYLHRALESLWKRIQTSENLRAISDSDLTALIETAVAESVSAERGSPFHQIISSAEQNRLRHAILYWLYEKEKKRSTPFSVEHLEERRTTELSGLQLRLRVDRIDRLKDGSVVLIDYKSGDISERSLEGDRPSEPQLLVYATAMQDPVDGVFLAQVRPREAKTVGAALHTHFAPAKNSKLDWHELRQRSRHCLQALAQEFMAGRAAVDPKRDACTYCNIKPLCRVQEGESVADAESLD